MKLPLKSSCRSALKPTATDLALPIIRYPQRTAWPALMQRPIADTQELLVTVESIVDQVRSSGDSALFSFTRKFDGAELKNLAITQNEIIHAKAQIPEQLKKAIELAKKNIEKFHSSQLSDSAVIETSSGVLCWQRALPISRVGLYVPAGAAPLFSTVLMLGVPAKLAGCEIVLCCPPDKFGTIAAPILYCADLLGIRQIYKVGGAQAIAAMAFGTASVPRVDKIFGPGNSYVNTAKQYVLARYGVAIDLPAGPTELLVIADQSSNAEFIAADLLSQAEHGADSQVILLSSNEELLQQVRTEVLTQLVDLPRKEIASLALQGARFVLIADYAEAIAFSNAYAPEHLILSVANAENLACQVTSAGSVFLGYFSPESAGDYATGPNHTLPTNGAARAYSGLSLNSFLKKITFQKLSEDGLRQIGSAVETMALAEGLYAHKNAVSVRLKSLEML